MALFDIFNVRGESWSDRLPLLETGVRYYHPDLVVLDGIRDLVADINDGVVAQDVVERLMRLATAKEEGLAVSCPLSISSYSFSPVLRPVY